MRKLIVIKHASPLVIPGTPAEKWRLSNKGKEACVPLAEALREHAPSILIASEEPKAAETAQIVAERLGVPFETAPGLHEHERSNVPHMRSGEFISHMELLFRKPAERVLGRESAEEALVRFRAAVESVLKQHAGTVGIVSHGTVIALFAAKEMDRNPFDLWREMKLPSFLVLSVGD